MSSLTAFLYKLTQSNMCIDINMALVLFLFRVSNMSKNFVFCYKKCPPSIYFGVYCVFKEDTDIYDSMSVSVTDSVFLYCKGVRPKCFLKSEIKCG